MTIRQNHHPRLPFFPMCIFILARCSIVRFNKRFVARVVGLLLSSFVNAFVCS